MVSHTFNHPRIELLASSSIRPNPKNPRTHSEKQLALLAASIQRFGFVVPIIVDDDNSIIAGDARFKAAVHKLGYEDLPAVRVRFLTEADRRAFALAENRLAELGGWDDALLKAELEFLFEADYEISVTGFELKDLDFSIDTPTQEELVEVPALDETAVSRPGDLWVVGPHRIYCGNSRDPASFEALLGDERASLVISDPPYNVRVSGHVSGLGKAKHREFVEASGDMTPAEYMTWLRSVFRNCVRFSSDGSIHFHFMDWNHAREILDAADGVYTEFKQLIVWCKTNAGMGTFYRSQHELVFVFKNGRGPHINNFALGQGGRYRTNVWSYAGCNTFRRGRDADLEAHPTVKPLALLMDAILDCSNCGDLVLDPFSGSGSTLVAAHKTKRRGAAIELDAIYVDTSLKRLCSVTGLSATLADGRTFDEVAVDRLEDSNGGL